MMKKAPLLVILSTALLMVGCGEQNSDKQIKVVGDPYHVTPAGFTNDAPKIKVAREDKEAQLELAKLKKEQALELAKIEAKAKEEKAKLELEAHNAKTQAEKEAKLNEHKTQKEIATSQQEIQKVIAAQKESTIIATQEKDISFYYIITGVVAGLILIALLMLYLAHRKNKNIEAKLQEDKLRHEEQMQMSKHYHEKTNKILDMISSESTDPNIKGELIKILQFQEQNQMLLAAPKEDSKKADDDHHDDDAAEAEVEEIHPS